MGLAERDGQGKGRKEREGSEEGEAAAQKTISVHATALDICLVFMRCMPCKNIIQKGAYTMTLILVQKSQMRLREGHESMGRKRGKGEGIGEEKREASSFHHHVIIFSRCGQEG